MFRGFEISLKKFSAFSFLNNTISPTTSLDVHRSPQLLPHFQSSRCRQFCFRANFSATTVPGERRAKTTRQYFVKLRVYSRRAIVFIASLTTCAGNWLRTITSDRTVYKRSSLSFSSEFVGMISLDRNYWEVINLLHFNIIYYILIYFL